MRSFGFIMSLVSTLVLATPLVLHGSDQEPTEIEIDCDAGERLEGVFGPVNLPRRAVELYPDVPLVIYVRGTCVGNLVIERNNVTLRGESSQTTILRGEVDASGEPVGSVVKALHADNLIIQDLRIERGVVGLEAIRSDVRLGRVLIRENVFGVFGRSSSTEVLDSDIADNKIGVSSWKGDDTSLTRTDIVRSSILAVSAFEGKVGVIDARITGRASISGSSGSSVFLKDVQLTPDTTFGFILLGSQSRLLVDGSLEAPNVLFGAFGKSLVQILGSVTLDRFLVSDDSYLNLFGNLDGDVLLFDFGAADVTGTLDGRLGCFPTTDAICRGSVGQSDCASCQASRLSSPMDRPTDVESLMRDKLRRLEQGGPRALLEEASER